VIGGGVEGVFDIEGKAICIQEKEYETLTGKNR
jgi:hypothetical protein